MQVGLRITLTTLTVLATVGSVAAFQSSAPQKPYASYDASAQPQHVAEWPYVPDPPGATTPQNSSDPKHLPGSSELFSEKEINGVTSVDWFPGMHPKAPASVVTGKPGVYRSCGTCHLITGYGKSDIDSLNGKQVAYMRQQMEDMKNDVRHASEGGAGLENMIKVAKALPEADETEALEYFHSVPATKWIRVVETSTVPKTMPARHQILAIDPSGATEPIGNRIIEVPENFDRTNLRDPSSGFLAYVPKGSVAKGKVLVRVGLGGHTVGCIACHGEDLRGRAEFFPPIAGRSPSGVARQLYDFKTGARHGNNAALMKPAVENLTDEDIVDISAYLASLPQ